ncbi:MAG: hypothetical protein R3A78_15225 [Polyangiales bacterium]
MLSLALGGKTYKLPFGHRGLNQPVKDLATGRVEVTTQNHGFVVDVASLSGKCEMTHVHLNDDTCEGVVHKRRARSPSVPPGGGRRATRLTLLVRAVLFARHAR